MISFARFAELVKTNLNLRIKFSEKFAIHNNNGGVGVKAGSVFMLIFTKSDILAVCGFGMMFAILLAD